jgi:hypothetical protein
MSASVISAEGPTINDQPNVDPPRHARSVINAITTNRASFINDIYATFGLVTGVDHELRRFRHPTARCSHVTRQPERLLAHANRDTLDGAGRTLGIDTPFERTANLARNLITDAPSDF